MIQTEWRRMGAPEDFTALARVRTGRMEHGWRIEGDEVTVELLRPDCRVRIVRGAAVWQLEIGLAPERACELYSNQTGAHRNFAMAELEFLGDSTEQYASIGGWRIEFGLPGSDCRIVLFAGIDYLSGEVILELRPRDNGADALRHCRWPGGFAPEEVSRTVMPFMQGILIPGDWPEAVTPYVSGADPEFAFCRANLYMPWWGVENRDGSAALLIVETADDAGSRLRHPAGGPTRLETGWEGSLGRMRMPRRVRIATFAAGDYVTLAKHYRRYRIERGEFVPLTRKIERTPMVEQLLGAGVLHFGIHYHFEPTSGLYNHADPAVNDVLVPAAEWAARIREFRRRAPRAYVHVDGWGFRGYDNLEPDLLPPGRAGGGWEGLAELGDACREAGYPWALHQQFRDHYCDAASFSAEHLVHDEAQQVSYREIWPGGREGWLCQKFAPDWVRRNNRVLREAGIRPDGAYLDVFSIVPPDECFHPEHPVSRGESLQLRLACWRLIRSFWGIASSEEPCDWALGELDLVHHGPWPLSPNPGRGPALGIPVPLFNLVYHDAVVIPWLAEQARGGWGCPDDDISWLHALANGAVPYFNFSDSDEQLRAKQVICDLHRRVGCLEMTDHRFEDAGCRRSRTCFADGTEVTVDQRDGSWHISAG